MLCEDCNSYRFPDCSKRKQTPNTTSYPSTRTTRHTKVNTTANVLFADMNKNKTTQPPIVTVIRCYICNYEMDSTCYGIRSDAVNKLIDIIQYTGWVCTDCRTNSQQKIDKLQAASQCSTLVRTLL